MTTTDYSALLNNSNFFPSWQENYNESLTYPENILELCKKTVVLPYDFYNIIAVYFLIPSALVKRIPYLFFYGLSGSGKSTMAKLASYIHGVTPVTSSTTYAAIRNELRSNKTKCIMASNPKEGYPDMPKIVEANHFMVLEDIDDSTLRRNPNLYALFKCGYDKQTDTIKMSGEKNGTNESFRCFAPKVFSSIHPIHAIEEYKELRRRLIVIPFKKLDDVEFLDIDSLDWSNFKSKFNEFWSYEQAEILLITRNSLNHVKGLTSSQKAICLDLIAVGISTGIWSDETVAVQELKDCFDWLKQDVQIEQSPITSLLQQLVNDLEDNSKKTNTNCCIYTHQLRTIVDAWYAKGYLFEKPNSKSITRTMQELGYRSIKGQWTKKL